MTVDEYTGLLREWAPDLLIATGQTIRMALGAYAVGAICGLGIALLRISKRPLLVGMSRVYIEVMRGMPALTVLFLIYFGLGSVGLKLTAFVAAVIGLGLNYAAYMAEAYRAGLESVERRQREAAQAIGMVYSQFMAFIIIPQAARVIAPPMTNYLVLILQDTAVASLISAPELMLRARELSAEYFTPLELYVTAGAIYLVIGFALSLVVRLMRRRLGARRSRALAEPLPIH